MAATHQERPSVSILSPGPSFTTSCLHKWLRTCDPHRQDFGCSTKKVTPFQWQSALVDSSDLHFAPMVISALSTVTGLGLGDDAACVGIGERLSSVPVPWDVHPARAATSSIPAMFRETARAMPQGIVPKIRVQRLELTVPSAAPSLSAASRPCPSNTWLIEELLETAHKTGSAPPGHLHVYGQVKRFRGRASGLGALAGLPVHPLEEGVHVRQDREVVELVLRNVMEAFVQTSKDLGSAFVRGEAAEGSSVVRFDVELVMTRYRSVLHVSHMNGLGEPESHHRVMLRQASPPARRGTERPSGVGPPQRTRPQSLGLHAGVRRRRCNCHHVTRCRSQ